uniref:Protein SHQ1 homolog n=1 Tax=Glossina brevipalpis TaxID=37001 RepID=A0A1A9W1L3_9MUSC
MSNIRKIICEYRGNLCELQVPLSDLSDNSNKREIINVRNSDIWLGEYHFLIYVDVRLFKFRSYRLFDTKDIKNLMLFYNNKQHVLFLQLPCLPANEEEERRDNRKIRLNEKKSLNGLSERPLDLSKLKRITDICRIQLNDDNQDFVKLEAKFDYGFSNKFHGKIRNFECDLKNISRITEPSRSSPLQRSIDRNIHEMRDFSRDQYKLNFVELQIPDGHDNPALFNINFKDTTLTRDEQSLLHNLTCKPEMMKMAKDFDQVEVDCGLISILLAICYDIRSTTNEVNCESAWTRSILTPTLYYFEPFHRLRDVVISFYRRSLIYPLYRNYEFSRHCVEDCIQALQMHSDWLVKQLLITHELFNVGERAVFNYYYLDDYIRYITNPSICPAAHLQMLAYNIKNILLDIFKKHLGLGLTDLESELLKELITDIHIAASTSGDESEDQEEGEGEADDAGTESCESEFCNSNESSDTEENSVIEKQMNELKL